MASMVTAPQTISGRMAAAGGRASGFDYLRIILAIAITAHHGVGMSYGFEAQMRFASGPFNPVIAFLLPAFFALSGFLVSGSLDRTKTLVTFLGLRALRIFPALAVDTIFCAIVLGIAFTTLPLPEYLSSPELHAYFLNIVGDIHYTLPGVFKNNPHPRINGQLWTIPFELECYIALAAAAAFGLFGRKRLFLAALAAAYVILLGNDLLRHPPHVVGVSGRALVLCFLTGVAFHLYREKVPHSIGCLALAASMLGCIHVFPAFSYLLPLPTAYITVYLGLLNPRKAWPLETGDYSYGVFLYGSPIQQAVVAAIPAARGNWLVEYPISLVFILTFAVLSWHLVEKHALAQKRRLYALEPTLLRLSEILRRRFSRGAVSSLPT